MKNAYLLLLALAFFGNVCSSQFKVTKPNSAFLPKSITFKGNIVNTAQWVDSVGDNIVILTETGIHSSTPPNDDGTFSDGELYAYHYLVQKDSTKLLWRVYDFIKSCPVDLKANFINGTFAVTDLNRNGKAEIWLMYKTVCHGDVSPSTMKIIMYEGSEKFAMRGTNKVKVAANRFDGGEFSFDDAFKTGPEAFRQYAQQLWQNNIMENWE